MISRKEALLLLDKLCGCRRVRCRISSSVLGVWIDGKLRRVGSTVFLESSGFALDLRITEDMGFEYVEPREVLGVESAEGIVSGLGIALPPLRMRDKIVFLELES